MVTIPVETRPVAIRYSTWNYCDLGEPSSTGCQPSRPPTGAWTTNHLVETWVFPGQKTGLVLELQSGVMSTSVPSEANPNVSGKIFHLCYLSGVSGKSPAVRERLRVFNDQNINPCHSVLNWRSDWHKPALLSVSNCCGFLKESSFSSVKPTLVSSRYFRK